MLINICATICICILMVLKLEHKIDISWFLVFLPLYLNIYYAIADWIYLKNKEQWEKNYKETMKNKYVNYKENNNSTYRYYSDDGG